MRLHMGCNKLQVYVYAVRTFKEDVLLFYNDVSLRKPLSTEQVSAIFREIFLSDCEDREQTLQFGQSARVESLHRDAEEGRSHANE